MIMRCFKIPTRLRALAPALLAAFAFESGLGLATPSNAQAQPLSVGDAPYACVSGAAEGNFGTLKLPRAG